MTTIPLPADLRESQKRIEHTIDSFYTGHLKEFRADDLHKDMRAVLGHRDVATLKFWTATVQTASGRQVGRLDIAMDANKKEACGTFRALRGRFDIASAVEWFFCEEPYHAALAVWSTLDEMGLFDHFEEIIARTIARSHLS